MVDIVLCDHPAGEKQIWSRERSRLLTPAPSVALASLVMPLSRKAARSTPAHAPLSLPGRNLDNGLCAM